MKNLVKGAKLIKKEERKLIKFAGEPVTKQYLEEFCEDITFDDASLACLSEIPKDDIRRSGILLSLAAMKSNTFRGKTVSGYHIAVRRSDTATTNWYLDIDHINCLHICEDIYGDVSYRILFMSPRIFSDASQVDVLLEAVIKACNKASAGRLDPDA